jgi:hypothetical protein
MKNWALMAILSSLQFEKTPQYKCSKALKTTCFQGFHALILRGLLLDSKFQISNSNHEI